MSKTLRRGRGTPSPKKSKSTTSSVISDPKPRVFVRRQFELPKKPSSSPKKIVNLKKGRKFKQTRATVEFIEVSKTPEELSFIPKESKKNKSKKNRKKNKENIEFIIVEDF